MSVFGDFMVSQASKQDEELLRLKKHVALARQEESLDAPGK